MKRILFALACVFTMSFSQAQESGYDKSRFANGLEQIANSNRNYFKNVGWVENSWYVLSNWYPDVLLLKNDEKAKLAKVINSNETIKRFDALNKKKIEGGKVSLQDVEEFNIYLWNELEKQVKSIYGE